MDTGRIINLLFRTLFKRGVRQQVQRKLTGGQSDTAEGRARQKALNQNVRRANQAVRVIRRIGKF